MSSLKIVVLAVLFGLGLVVAILAGDRPSLVLNLGTEFMGGVAIYFILDHLIGGRERREAAEREMEVHKKDLIAQMGSRVRDVAIAAAEELRARGWLNDGSLQRVLLGSANLQGADLKYARFDETTTLPDDTKWIPDTDMARFTDPQHPEFWRSDDPKSSAHEPRD